MILTLTTNQITAFKTSFQVLDTLISEVNLEISATGIVIREVNKSSKLLVSLTFLEENFDTYEYKHALPTFNLGIDLSSITQRLKSPLKYDSLSLSISESSAHLRLENFSRKEKKSFKLKTLKSCPVSCSVAPVEYSVCVTISSDLLNKYVKELNASCETFSISVNSGSLCESRFLCLENSETSYTLYESNYLSILSEDNVDVSTTLIGTYFCLLSKLASLHETVSIYLANNSFTSCKYTLGSLGSLVIVLL